MSTVDDPFETYLPFSFVGNTDFMCWSQLDFNIGKLQPDRERHHCSKLSWPPDYGEELIYRDQRSWWVNARIEEFCPEVLTNFGNWAGIWRGVFYDS